MDNDFVKIDLFKATDTFSTEHHLDSFLTSYNLIDLNTEAKDHLFRSSFHAISVDIPIDQSDTVTLELVEVDIHTPDFKITTSSGLTYFPGNPSNEKTLSWFN